MPTATTDWRDIQDDREKYQAYLCSREWAEKREAVKERAGGKCERCTVLPIDAVHHLTYKRKYAERLEDLSAICTPCHEFTHGKSDFDPLQYRWELRYLSTRHDVFCDPPTREVMWDMTRDDTDIDCAIEVHDAITRHALKYSPRGYLPWMNDILLTCREVVECDIPHSSIRRGCRTFSTPANYELARHWWMQKVAEQ